MRRQIRVMAAHNVEGSAQAKASQIQSKRVKWNIVKTMLIVSVCFIVCWFPSSFYFIIVDHTAQTSSNLYAGYYATVFLIYFYICMNPFIYAIKHEGVKETLAGLMACMRKRVGAVAEVAADVPAGSNSSNRNKTGSTQQTRT